MATRKLGCLLAAIAALGSAPPAQTESPRRQTLLPNGAAILVERFPDAKVLSVQLFAGVRGVQETRSKHGWRHLLEHLILKGKDGNLDGRMESEGVFFTGRTYRDAMQIEFTGPPAKFDVMLSGLREIMATPLPGQEAIAREVAIMGEEFALRSDASLLSAEVWSAAFQDAALDPFGDLDPLSKATGEALAELRAIHFAPANLALVISGPVDADATTEKLKPFLQDLEGPAVRREITRKGEPSRRESDSAFGEVRAAIIRGPAETGSVLCAAFAIAASVEGAGVTYTPSADTGLVLVTRTDANNTIGRFVDGLSEGEIAALFPIGRAMAERYLQSSLTTPSGAGYWRGMLLCQNPAVRPDDLLSQIKATDWPHFKDAFAKFGRASAAIAVGVRP